MEGKRIRCGSRKEQTCKEVPEVCIWDGQKCKLRNLKGPKTNACGRRKETRCKELPEMCDWNGIKCVPKKKVVHSPQVTPKTVVCARRKEVKCKEAPHICTWDGSKCKNLDKAVITPKRTTVKTPAKSPDKKHVELIEKLQNRHCMYYSQDSNAELQHKVMVDFKDCHKTKYDSKYKPLTNVHIGQRKLLLSEIQMLTEYYRHNTHPPVVLYVGAAPGTHLILLSYMFPDAFFVLYDGAKFDPQLKQYPRIYEIHEGTNGFVTTAVIHNIKKRLNLHLPANQSRLLFVSDIRLGNDDKAEFEHGVMRDMQLQEEWMDILT